MKLATVPKEDKLPELRQSDPSLVFKTSLQEGGDKRELEERKEVFDLQFGKRAHIDNDLLQQAIKKGNMEDALEFLRSKQRLRIIDEFQVYGNFEPLTGDKWQKSYLLAKEDSCLLTIKHDKLSYILSQNEQSHKYKELTDFLKSAIAGFDKISKKKRERLMNCFTEKEYPGGTCLLKEGELPRFGYIILEGECVMVSKKSPLLNKVMIDGEIKKKRTGAITNKGFVSETTNQYKIGIIGRGCWIGAETILFSGMEEKSPKKLEDNAKGYQSGENKLDFDKIFNYSVISQVKVKVLEINRQDMMQKLP